MVQSRELVTEYIWSQVNLHCFGLPDTWYFMRFYINLVKLYQDKNKKKIASYLLNKAIFTK